MNHLTLLKDHLSQNKDLSGHIEKLISGGDFDIDWDFLGFLEDYKSVSEIMSRRIVIQESDWIKPRNFIIVDVGCAAGIQQIFFNDFTQYIGIDQRLGKNKLNFNDNSVFIQGEFSQLVESGEFEITDNMVGIASMSLLYSNNQQAIKTFDNFKRKFIF